MVIFLEVGFQLLGISRITVAAADIVIHVVTVVAAAAADIVIHAVTVVAGAAAAAAAAGFIG